MNKNLQKWLPIFLLAVTVLFGAWIIYTTSNKKKSVVKSPVQNKGPSSPSGLSVTGGLKESYRMKFSTLDEMRDVILNVSWRAPTFLGLGSGELKKYKVIIKTANTEVEIINMNVDIDTGTIEFGDTTLSTISTDGVSVTSSLGISSPSINDASGSTNYNNITMRFSDPFWEATSTVIDGNYVFELKYIDARTSTNSFSGTNNTRNFSTDGSGKIAEANPTIETVQLDPEEITSPGYSIELIYPPEKRFFLRPTGQTKLASVSYEGSSPQPPITFFDDALYNTPYQYTEGGISKKATFDIVIISVDGYNNIYRLGFYAHDQIVSAQVKKIKYIYVNESYAFVEYTTSTIQPIYFKIFEAINGDSSKVTIAYEITDTADALDAFNQSELTLDSKILVYDSVTNNLVKSTVREADFNNASFTFESITTLPLV